jgi:hypothetical protein
MGSAAGEAGHQLRQRRVASGAAAFRKGLGESGYVDGRNVTIEYYWLEGQYDRLPALTVDLVRRRVAIIATPATPLAAIAAKAITATIPIVFGVGEDPVEDVDDRSEFLHWHLPPRAKSKLLRRPCAHTATALPRSI